MIALLVQRGFRRIQVLRFALTENPPAEGDDATVHVLNGDDEPAAEQVIAALRDLGNTGQPGLLGQRLPNAQAAQVTHQPLAVAGREPEHEPLDGAGFDLAPIEIIARAGAFRVLQAALVKLGRLGHHRLQVLPVAVSFLLGRIQCRHPEMGQVRQKMDGLGVGEVLQFHHQLDHVAAFAAAETVIALELFVDRKTGCLLGVEGAEGEVILAFAGQFQEIPSHLDDVEGMLQLLDELGRNAHG